jgi:hypothetical protein
MNLCRQLGIVSVVMALAVSAAGAAASKVTSDLAPHQKRQETVDRALKLTRPPVPAPVPENLPQPFNPAGFDQPDPDEQRAGVAGGPARSSSAGPATAPAGPVGDRELLEAIAPRIQPTGSFIIGGKPLLTFPGAKRVSIGDVITVQFNEREYDITITSIDRTNFTLRYRGEEITRPIKPTK